MTILARYGFAALLVLAGTLGMQAFQNVFDIERAPFFLFTPFVLVATIVGGLGPGIFATFLGSVAVERVLIVSTGGQGPPELARLALFVIVGVGISVLGGNLKAARQLAEAKAHEATVRADELATARAAAERHAREAERRAAEFEALFAVSPVGIARADDPECRHVDVNPSLAKRIGLPKDANASFSPPPDRAPPLRALSRDGSPLAADDLPLQRAARTRQPVLDVEFDVIRTDGDRLILLGHAVPLLDEQGGVRGALGVFTDVTEDRRAATEQRFLAEATRVLSASLDYAETLRRAVALALPDMADLALLDIADTDGRITRRVMLHRDPAIQRWLDDHDPLRRDPPTPGLTLLDFARQPRLVAPASEDAMRQAGATDWQVERLRPLAMSSVIAVPLVLHGAQLGAFAWVRCGARSHFDARDLAVAEEVARRTSLAVENARLYEDAQSASRMKDEFVATLSHELRTPLNALLGWTDLLRSGRLSAERAREAIEAIHRTATAQAQLTNDLVDVSRAVSGKFQLSPCTTEIGQLVRSAVETFRLAAEAKGLWLRCDLAPDLPSAVVDPDRVRQIAYNLVGNAVKFTSSGGVDVAARRDGDWVEIAVTDTGVGIDPGFLPYVFDRFRQFDGSVRRSFGGLGLGLSIARALAELHGGTIAAASDGEGRGATFTVRLPLAPPTARRPAEVTTEQSA